MNEEIKEIEDLAARKQTFLLTIGCLKGLLSSEDFIRYLSDLYGDEHVRSLKSSAKEIHDKICENMRKDMDKLNDN